MANNVEQCNFNKLRDIKPTLNSSSSIIYSNRRDQIVISRCRIGHTRLTHSYLLKREEAPKCIPCDEHFNVKHVLLDCQDLKYIRDKHFKVNSLKELFESVSSYAILHFLKEINVYNKI